MKWAQWIIGIRGPELQLLAEKPCASGEPSLSRPLGSPIELKPEDTGLPIRALERIYPAPAYEPLQ
jgi:hypothetical protein